MGEKHKPAGSKVGTADPKNKPETKTTIVRRIKAVNTWFVPKPDLSGNLRTFDTGILHDVVFDPNAPIMKDVICGTDRVSEATATGILEVTENEPRMPADAKTTREVDYHRGQKVFHTRGKPTETFQRCDNLVLRLNGTSLAGWKTATIEG
ncbi:MAG: hypothetical protein RLY57_647 [Candidatus Parcubacteria bacterium]|jgi:uncharacterized protein (UPF0147 family)